MLLTSPLLLPVVIRHNNYHIFITIVRKVTSILFPIRTLGNCNVVRARSVTLTSALTVKSHLKLTTTFTTNSSQPCPPPPTWVYSTHTDISCGRVSGRYVFRNHHGTSSAIFSGRDSATRRRRLNRLLSSGRFCSSRLRSARGLSTSC